jgi:hypothetical protein
MIFFCHNTSINKTKGNTMYKNIKKLNSKFDKFLHKLDKLLL